MNILLVDDDADVIEGMLDAIDFRALGMDMVYIAHSAEQAMSILQVSPVQVMITDIEMPDRSGIELLTWIRDRGLPIVTIFCTCFANFDYAKKAVELHSFDYFLKPIAYADLSRRITLAMEESRKVQQMEGYQEYLNAFALRQEESRAAFWPAYLSQGGDPEALGEKYRDSALTTGQAYIFVLIYIFDDQTTLGQGKDYLFMNICGEAILGKEYVRKHAGFMTQDQVFMLILEKEPDFRADSFAALLKGISADCRDREIGVCFYYQEDCSLAKAVEKYSHLLSVYLNDLRRFFPVVCTQNFIPPAEPPCTLPGAEIENLLAAGQAQPLLSLLFRQLDHMAEKNMLSRSYVKFIHMDIMQRIHTILSEKKISAHELFGTPDFDTLRSQATLSLDCMKRYLSHVVTLTAQAVLEKSKSTSVVGQICAYIDSHLDEELSRNALAAMVFLNPDYLARQFKNETGDSLGTYILNARIKEAKRLLRHSELSIYEISQKVGYDNFSYFSHLFHDKTGATPHAYRKSHHTACDSSHTACDSSRGGS